MFILKKGHQPGVYVPLRALFLVLSALERHCPLSDNSSSTGENNLSYDIIVIHVINMIYPLCVCF